MRTFFSSRVFVFAVVVGLGGCEDQSLEESADESPQSLRVALSYEDSDVTAARFDVVGADEPCSASPLATEIVALTSSDGAPLTDHPFASTTIVLAPGTYRVCATPLSGDMPSAECAATDALSTVSAEQTTELMLVSQCAGDPTGGASPVVSLNKPPRIQRVTLSPSKYITVCETLSLSATATDPEGDAIAYAWALSAGSPDAHLREAGSSATFSGPAGDYLIALTVTDEHEGHASLTIPVHVSNATCRVPKSVHDIFLAKCTPCHTTNPTPSAGMSLATPESAYANLVQHSVAGSACTSRVRVIPGDAASSYIIAKLRGEAGICGAQMPRNRPPLPDSEIQAIEAWIDALPH